jgi:hypothetical protein
MSVLSCHLCERNPLEARRYGGEGLAEGQNCPICFEPTCRYHLTYVRWRWRETGEVEAALVCKECKRTYAHRDWDAFHREWIT